jgi:outer membrane protein
VEDAAMSITKLVKVGRRHDVALVVALAMGLPASALSQQMGAVTDSGSTLGPRLSLETIVAQTLSHSPNVVGATSAVRTASAARRVAVGAFLPSLALSSIGGWSDQSAVTTAIGTPTSSTMPTQSTVAAGVTAFVDVFTGGRRSAQLRQADMLSRAADADVVLQRYATIFSAKQGYFNVLRAHELTRVAADQVTQAGLGLQYARRQEQAGTATHADVLSAQLALTTALQQQLAAIDTLHLSAAALGRLVGVDGSVDAEPMLLEPTPLAMSDTEVVSLALATAPSVGLTRAQASADTATVRAAKSFYVPTITAGAGYNWSNNQRFPGGLRPGWVMTFTTTFPLFDGFVREATITDAEAITDFAASTATDTRRFVRAESVRLLGDLHVAESSVALTRESVGLAIENLRLFRARYSAGIATILDVLTAQTSLVQAELSVVSARYTYQSARAALEALLGRELPVRTGQ